MTKQQRLAKKKLKRFKQRTRKAYLKAMGCHKQGPDVKFGRGRYEFILDFVKPSKESGESWDECVIVAAKGV